MDWLTESIKNPTWQFAVATAVTLVLGLGGIIATIWVARSKKKLSYQLLENTPLVSVGEEVKGQVEIRFFGNPVKNVRLLILKVKNSGYRAIAPGDYVVPVEFRLNEGSQILSVDIIDANPPQLKASLNPGLAVATDAPSILFPSALLNAGDWLKIKSLVSDFEGEITVHGRIVDVKQIKEARPSLWAEMWPTYLWCVGIGCLAIITVIWPGIPFFYLMMLWSLVMMGMLGLAVWLIRRSVKGRL